MKGQANNMGLIILPFDLFSQSIQRIVVGPGCTYFLSTLNTSSAGGSISFTLPAGSALNAAWGNYFFAQSVLTLIDNAQSSTETVDLSSRLPFQIITFINYQGQTAIGIGKTSGVFGCKFTPGMTATLTNQSATVTLPLTINVSSPGLFYFTGPDNTVPPYNALDTADINTLTLTNPDGTTTSIGGLGWT